MLIVVASVEACNSIYLQQCVTEAAYEGAMAAIKINSDEQSVIDLMDTMMTARGFTGASYEVIGVNGNSFDQVQKGDLFEVTVTIAATDNMVLRVISEYTEFSATRVGKKQ